MKKIFFLLPVFFIICSLHTEGQIRCGVNDILSPERLAFEEDARVNRNASSQSGILHVPVVFHVIYHAAIENVSTAVIMAQMDTIARDYRRRNADTINTPTAFKSLAADAEIEFCLATRDPSGNPSTGITRTLTDSLTFVAGPGSVDHMKYTSTGGIDAWDTHKYINIWVVNYTGASGFAGGAMGHGSAVDGIVMNYTILNGTHLLSHEIGHYLDLFHIYGSETPNCEAHDSGDMVSDTPDQAWSTFGCPAFPQTDSCTTVAPGIMFMNFMDQTNSTCQNLFTLGQVTRMRNTLNGARASLLTSDGCLATSVNEISLNNSIRFSPNPFSDFSVLQISGSAERNGVLRIFDLFGRMVNEIDIRNQKTEISREKLLSGMYFFTFESSAGGFASGKLLIQ